MRLRALFAALLLAPPAASLPIIPAAGGFLSIPKVEITLDLPTTGDVPFRPSGDVIFDHDGRLEEFRLLTICTGCTNPGCAKLIEATSGTEVTPTRRVYRVDPICNFMTTGAKSVTVTALWLPYEWRIVDQTFSFLATASSTWDLGFCSTEGMSFTRPADPTVTCTGGAGGSGSVTWEGDCFPYEGTFIDLVCGTGTTCTTSACPASSTLGTSGVRVRATRTSGGADLQDVGWSVIEQTLEAVGSIDDDDVVAPGNGRDVSIALAGTCPDIGAGAGVDGVCNCDNGGGASDFSFVDSLLNPLVGTDACGGYTPGAKTIRCTLNCGTAPAKEVAIGLVVDAPFAVAVELVPSALEAPGNVNVQVTPSGSATGEIINEVDCLGGTNFVEVSRFDPGVEPYLFSEGVETWEGCPVTANGSIRVRITRAAQQVTPAALPYTVATPPPIPDLTVTPASISISAFRSGATTTCQPIGQSITVGKVGTGTLHWSSSEVGAQADFLSSTPTSGTDGATVVPSCAGASGLAIGIYSRTLRFVNTDNPADSHDVAVTLTVSAAPVVGSCGAAPFNGNGWNGSLYGSCPAPFNTCPSFAKGRDSNCDLVVDLGGSLPGGGAHPQGGVVTFSRHVEMEWSGGMRGTNGSPDCRSCPGGPNVLYDQIAHNFRASGIEQNGTYPSGNCGDDGMVYNNNDRARHMLLIRGNVGNSWRSSACSGAHTDALTYFQIGTAGGWAMLIRSFLINADTQIIQASSWNNANGFGTKPPALNANSPSKLVIPGVFDGTGTGGLLVHSVYFGNEQGVDIDGDGVSNFGTSGRPNQKSGNALNGGKLNWSSDNPPCGGDVAGGTCKPIPVSWFIDVRMISDLNTVIGGAAGGGHRHVYVVGGQNATGATGCGACWDNASGSPATSPTSCGFVNSAAHCTAWTNSGSTAYFDFIEDAAAWDPPGPDGPSGIPPGARLTCNKWRTPPPGCETVIGPPTPWPAQGAH
jgi:hypothetical protein